MNDSWDPFGHPYDENERLSGRPFDERDQPVDLDQVDKLLEESEDEQQEEKEQDDEEEMDESRTLVAVVTASLYDREEEKDNSAASEEEFHRRYNTFDPFDDEQQQPAFLRPPPTFSKLGGVHGAAQAVQETNMFVDVVLRQRERQRSAYLQEQIRQLQDNEDDILSGLTISVHDDLDTVREKYLLQVKIIQNLQAKMEAAKANEVKQAQQLENIQSYLALQQSTLEKMRQQQEESKRTKTCSFGCPIEQRLALQDVVERFHKLGSLFSGKQQRADTQGKSSDQEDKAPSGSATGASCGLFGVSSSVSPAEKQKTSTPSPQSSVSFLPLWFSYNQLEDETSSEEL